VAISYTISRDVALAESVGWAIQQINKMLKVDSQAVRSGPARTSHDTNRADPGYYDDPLRSLWMHLGLEGQRLMAAAVLLILVLDRPLDMLPAPVADVADRLGTVLRDSPKRIEEIRRLVLAKQ
jgi:hypothetical protein